MADDDNDGMFGAKLREEGVRNVRMTSVRIACSVGWWWGASVIT